jgi:hypothetical protein
VNQRETNVRTSMVVWAVSGWWKGGVELEASKERTEVWQAKAAPGVAECLGVARRPISVRLSTSAQIVKSLSFLQLLRAGRAF